MAPTPEPFRIAIPDAAIADLHRRLDATRWSPEIANGDWGYGFNGAALRDLTHYWRHGFDWRAQEAKINRFEHFRVELEPGVPVHFIRARGKGPAPIPLILTHGWPWTFWDWHKLIAPLSDPAAHGGDPRDAFDVIVPSLPGYGFSTPLTVPGITAPRVADLWHKLMREVLGYDRFAAAGGDWGSFVTWELGTRYVPDMIAIYLSFPPIWHAGGIENLRQEDYTGPEEDWLRRTLGKWESSISHLTVHSRDHQTLAWGLNDSPVGLAAWLLERRRNWSDCRGDLEGWFGRDELITNVSLYWFTQTIASSMQLYAEQFRAGSRTSDNYTGAQLPARIEAPTGIGVYPAEVSLMPRHLCEKAANVVYWNVHEAGGHFAPAEVPDAYLADLRTHFRAFR